MSRLRIGVDTGGTFTDLVVVDEETGQRRTVKVSSTPAEPAAAVFESLGRAECAPDEIAYFVLGTTIATNCLLQRQGQRTLYLTTAGFEDVPYIQRVDRKSLYDLQWQKPEPYVARQDCIGVRERIAADGSVRMALDAPEVARVVDLVRRADESAEHGVAVAISFLFSYLRPEHEQELAAALRDALPSVAVAVSSEVAPIWREYERANTVIVDAYLRRLTGEFAQAIDRGLEEFGATCPRFLLKSNGGQIPTSTAARQPVNFILSGLAGGLIGGRHFAGAVGAKDVVTLDMGGTSADVGVVVDGRIRSSSNYQFEWGLPIAIPVIDLTTIGAGGSSIAGFDQGGFLKVGPASAGADPGPASYGLGSELPTVTDANLVLGRLNPDYFLGGELPLDPERARSAVQGVADRLEVELEEGAQAIVEVASENMANAIRLLCADRGLDYRDFDLEAFGGAGPLHGAELARRVGLRRVIVPPNPGLASAFGAQAADLRVDRRTTRLFRSDLATDSGLRAVVHELASATVGELRGEGATAEPTLIVTASCRYLGQNYEQDVAVPLDAPGDLVELMVERFHSQHERAYGYRLGGTVVEFVYLNASAIEHRSAPPEPPIPGGELPDPVAARPVFFKRDGWVETAIYRREGLPAAAVLRGPALVEEIDSTTLVPADQTATVHPSGCLIISEGSEDPTLPCNQEQGVARV